MRAPGVGQVAVPKPLRHHLPVLPQLDAKALLIFKRAVPAGCTRDLGLSSESRAGVLRNKNNKNKETASWHSNTATCSR
jgi:hypothetical protein